MTAWHDAHVIVGWVLIVSNAVMGVWCLLAQQRPALRGTALWAGVVVAQSTTFAEATIGAVLSRQQGVELHDMHALYGFSALVAVAIMYGYRTSPFLKGKEYLLYGLGGLFVMGLGLRNLVL